LTLLDFENFNFMAVRITHFLSCVILHSFSIFSKLLLQCFAALTMESLQMKTRS